MTTTEGEARFAISAVVRAVCPNAANGRTSKMQSRFFMAISRIFRRSLRKEHWDLIVRNLIVALLHDEKWAMKRPAVAEGPEVKRRVFELTERRCVLMWASGEPSTSAPGALATRRILTWASDFRSVAQNLAQLAPNTPENDVQTASATQRNEKVPIRCGIKRQMLCRLELWPRGDAGPGSGSGQQGRCRRAGGAAPDGVQR